MSVPRKLSFGDSNGDSRRRSPNKKTSPPRGPRLQHHHSAPGVITTLHTNENTTNLPPSSPNSSGINSKLLNKNKKPRLRESVDGLASSPAVSSGNLNYAVSEVQAAHAVSSKGPSSPDFELHSTTTLTPSLAASESPARPSSPTSPTRWAGGAFHNSPPPSKLPVPAFSQSPKRQASSPVLAQPYPVPSTDAYVPPPMIPGAVYPVFAPLSYEYPPSAYAPAPMGVPAYVPIASMPMAEPAPSADPQLAQITRDLRMMLNIRA